MTEPPATPPPSQPHAARGMWVIAVVLSVGALSLLTAALPGRARPLFLLPLAFGMTTSALAIALRRSLSLPPATLLWLLTAAVALGGYGQVVASSYRDYDTGGEPAASDQNAIVALQMLQGAEHAQLREQLQADLDARRRSWDQFLSRRYAALGTVSPRTAHAGLVLETLLVIAGVALGRRFLDAGKPPLETEQTISAHPGATPPG